MAVDQIEEIKQKLDIVDLVGGYIPLAKSGKNYKALCPLHSEKTPSFMVSPQLQIFKCFGCGEGGDVISFYSKMEGVPFGEALKQMAKRAGVKLVGQRESPEEQLREKIYQINRLAADFFHFLLLNHRVGEGARKFLQHRGVSKEAIETFNLGYAPDSWDSLGRFILSKNYTLTEFLQSGLGVRKEGGRGYFDFFRGRVMFPLRSPGGKVAGFAGRTLGQDSPKYINTVDTPVFAKGRYIFNLDLAKQEIKKEKTAILVEGEMDAIALYEKGIKNVVATKGTALSPDQISPLARFAQKLVICFDPDAAGLEATRKGLLLAQSVGLEVAASLLPPGRDPDELVRADPSSFKKLLEKAPPLFDFYLEAALSRHDPKTPSGKKEIAREILPVLKSLANEVEKAAYLAKLSQKIGIAEEVLWKQLEKEEPLEVEDSSRPPAANLASGGLPKKESYVLSLLFAFPEDTLKKKTRLLAPEEFAHAGLREILGQLKGYLKQIKRFRLENLSAKLSEELRRVFAELALSSDAASRFGPKELEGEFAKALAAVKRDYLVKARKALVNRVRGVEAAGRTREVRQIQKEILKLTKKIDAIT